MLAGLDRRHHLAHVDAVLDDGVAHRHVAQRDLVADRDVLPGVDHHGLVLVHDPAVERHAGLHAFHDDHGHGVARVVQYEMNHCLSFVCRTVGLPNWRPS